MLRVWRVCPAAYSAEIFSGEGSRRYPGRWHSPGRPMIYTSDSRSLSALEILANSLDRAALGSQRWVLAWAELPPPLIETPERFPEDWRAHPPPESTRTFGNAWFDAGRTPALRVPSAVILGEFNYLLNPRHPDFAQIRLGPPEAFSFDPRLR